MSFSPTTFRPLATGGFGAQGNWRGAMSVPSTADSYPTVDPQSLGSAWRGQVGTVVYRSDGVRQNYIIAGVTRDSSGAALGSCRVELYLTGLDLAIATATSDSSGNFTFSNPGSGPFYIVAYKAGSPDVAGTTVNTLVTSAPTGISFDFTTGSLPTSITFTRASSGTYTNVSGTTATAANDAARFNYLGGVRCLLIEPAATNLVLHSIDFITDYSPSDLTVSGSATTAPDGTSTASSIIADTTTGSHYIFMAAISVPTGVSNLSVFGKSAGYNYVVLSDDGTSTNTWFNISSGAVGTVGSGNTAGITSAGNGFYRSSTSRSNASTQTPALLQAQVDASFSFTGDGSSGAYVWGAQVEAGAVTTSYIPTSIGTATRAADNATFIIPPGVGHLTYTFDDNSTQLVAVSAGSYTIPTDLNRPNIKSIVSSG